DGAYAPLGLGGRKPRLADGRALADDLAVGVVDRRRPVAVGARRGLEARVARARRQAGADRLEDPTADSRVRELGVEPVLLRLGAAVAGRHDADLLPALAAPLAGVDHERAAGVSRA